MPSWFNEPISSFIGTGFPSFSCIAICIVFPAKEPSASKSASIPEVRFKATFSNPSFLSLGVRAFLNSSDFSFSSGEGMTPLIFSSAVFLISCICSEVAPSGMFKRTLMPGLPVLCLRTFSAIRL